MAASSSSVRPSPSLSSRELHFEVCSWSSTQELAKLEARIGIDEGGVEEVETSVVKLRENALHGQAHARQQREGSIVLSDFVEVPMKSREPFGLEK